METFFENFKVYIMDLVDVFYVILKRYVTDTYNELDENLLN